MIKYNIPYDEQNILFGGHKTLKPKNVFKFISCELLKYEL